MGIVVARVHLGFAVFATISRASADPPPLERDATPSRLFVLGIGFGGVSRMAEVAPTGGFAWTLQFGERVGCGLHLTEEYSAMGPGPYSPDATVSEAHATFLLGLRWTPFRANPRPQSPMFLYPGRYVDMTAFYVKPSIGFGFRERTSMQMDHIDWTPIAAVHVGYVPVQGNDWALGFELREQLEHFNDGLQHGWTFLGLVQVF